MSAEAGSIVAVVVVLLPTLYYLIASPTFLLANFQDPIVTKLFRDQLSFTFRLIGIGSIIGMVALVAAGRPAFAFGLAIFGATVSSVRHWFLRLMNTELFAQKAGDIEAAGRLRVLHWRGMAYNATQFAALIAMIAFVGR